MEVILTDELLEVIAEKYIEAGKIMEVELSFNQYVEFTLKVMNEGLKRKVV